MGPTSPGPCPSRVSRHAIGLATPDGGQPVQSITALSQGVMEPDGRLWRLMESLCRGARPVTREDTECAKITQIYEGTNQIQRVVIVKKLLG